VNVRVFLRTPLHRGRSTSNSRKFELNESVIEIVGEAEARDGGLDLKVKSLYSDKGEAVESPWARLFVPSAKIDCYVIE